MSYLSYPRINFYGRFFTDPSTVNNDPTHYEVENTVPSPWQNPNGLHRFQLQECSVVSAIGASGEVSDPLVNLPFITTDKPSSAKIADIDVYQQGVPTIYGMQVSIPISDGVSLTGLVDSAVLNQLWWVAVLATRGWQDSDYMMDSFGGDMNACGVYQSVIRVPQATWPDDSVSPVLALLKSRTTLEDGNYLISMRFVVDGYRNVPEDVNYQTGRITGSLGPVIGSEPRYNPGARMLAGRTQDKSDPWNWPMFNTCPFVIDQTRKLLILDLANGICRQNAGGAPVDLGTLTAHVTLADNSKVSLGGVDYSEFCYNLYSHIVEMPLTDAQLTQALAGSLSFTMSRTDIGPQVVFQENILQTNIEVEVRPIRMSGFPGTTSSTRVYVGRLQEPLVGKQLQVDVVSVHGNTPGATVPPSNPGNTPQADGAIEAEISPTDANGFATVIINVLSDPGSRTPQLDGQLYFINVTDPDQLVSEPISQSAMISCLVWSAYPIDENPTWPEIQEIFAGYVKLFPGMTEKINLIDYNSFQTFALNPPFGLYQAPPGPLGIDKGAIPFFMSREVTDPRYMPVTRDMSPERTMTVLYYVKNMQDNSNTPPTS
ncbi:hypothetical protein [Algoriphagus persicinus]|uniref:hypothetical protein n=1 Tax=Algoriphagus persicinus TaxID=3108754 RepID=UPI002B3C2467|nr:hypothetical protein [Algoriphagus sp. E1-3-M2]MEB2783516.1 hypothetical protein [Algoriphagus sp. E1-3-M2]